MACRFFEMETRFYLDKRAGKNGKNIPLKVAIASCHKTAFIATDVKLNENQWNAKTQKVIEHPSKKELNKRLGILKAQVDELLDRLTHWEKMPADDLTALKRRIEAEMGIGGRKPKPEDQNLFLNRFIRFAESRPTASTCRIYMATVNRMRAFCGAKLDRMTFEDITIDWLNKFNTFLAKTAPKRNARNIHFRNIRAVIREALDDEITRKNDIRKFDMSAEPTPKRSLSVEDLRVFFDFQCEPCYEVYRDLFKLEFMLAGINNVDLCNLKEINNGRIDYVRQKTHKEVSLRVEPEALALINKYRGKKWLVNVFDRISRHETFNQKMNFGLKRIGRVNQWCRGHKKELEPLFPFLTSYWARHTWATVACELDIPIEVIGRAMGHSGHSVTHIYIRYNCKKSDEANRKVLDWVLYGIIDGKQVVKPGTREFYGDKADWIFNVPEQEVESKDALTEEQPTTVDPPKRKRGRPRKNPEVTIQPKRKRGRPRKVTL